MSSELTEAQYAQAIPAWCSYRTMQQHLDMMLCWSLVGYAERGEPKPEHTCASCELYDANRSGPGMAVQNSGPFSPAARTHRDFCAPDCGLSGSEQPPTGP